MTRLAGKVAFITGAASGIGRATAVLFAREGAQVVVADIAAEAGEETAQLAGHGAIYVRTDVTDEASVQAAIRTTMRRGTGSSSSTKPLPSQGSSSRADSCLV